MSPGDTYSYEISYLTAAGQTPSSDAVTHTVGAGATSLLINFPWTPPTVNTIQLWRKEAVGIQIPQFYLLAQLPVGTTTFTDTLSHAQFIAQLSSQPVAPATWRSQGSYAPTYFPYYGYNCYGYGCLSSPPPAEQPDPNPLPDIEANFVPPKTYTGVSTQTAQCPAGTVQNGTTTVVPVMTSPTAPSGIVTTCLAPNNTVTGYESWRAFGTGPGWRSTSQNDCLIYQFPTPQSVTAFSITGDALNNNIPIAVELLGSNDGIHYTVLMSPQSVILSTGTIQSFQVTTPAAYTYYQLAITPAAGSSGVSACALWQMFIPCPSCTGFTSTETATSQVSQVAANAAAVLAAQAAAQALLAQAGCVAVYTSTKSYTALCSPGQYDGNNGQGFTASATYQSYISQADADANALAQATTNANNGLNCKNSNNTSVISINAPTIAATPYPSVAFYAGAITSISRVQVALGAWLMKAITGASDPTQQIQIFLVSPTGHGVCLMSGLNENGFTPTTRGNYSASLTFDSASSNPVIVTANIGVQSGTYEPTIFTSPTLPPAAPCPNISFPASFAALIGTNPAGAWSLWVVQIAQGGVTPLVTTIGGWTLTIS
jgi:hypothetical protein